MLTRKTTLLLKTSVFVALLFALPSCSNDKPDGADSAKKDTVAIAPLAPEVQALLPAFKDANLPFKTDSASLAAMAGENLNGDKVRLLSKNWFEHELSASIPYQLRDFYKIDSVKAKGAYKDWIGTLDIGQTMSSDAYALGKVKLGENTWALIWGLKYSSVEACPYFSGTDAYATILHNNQVGQTFLLGWERASGDPPVGGEYNLKGELGANGELMLWSHELTDEGDESLNVDDAAYTLKIEEGNFKLVNERKEPSKKIKKTTQA